MLSLKGTGVHKGIAVGKLVFYERQLFHVEKQTQEDTQTQVQRYRQAKEQAVMQVQTLHKLALREISSIYKAKIIDLSPDSMVFELTGKPDKIDAFLTMFKGYEILELCRTGVTALERGGKHPHMQKPPQEVRAAQLPLPGTRCPQDEE